MGPLTSFRPSRPRSHGGGLGVHGGPDLANGVAGDLLDARVGELGVEVEDPDAVAFQLR